jgi:hypothetical protein
VVVVRRQTRTQRREEREQTTGQRGSQTPRETHGG